LRRPAAPVLATLVGFSVLACWYAIGGRPWLPSHDDMVSMLLVSKGKERADAVLAPPVTSRRQAQELLDVVEPEKGYGVLQTVRDVYLLSINPPVYAGLLNFWRRMAGGSIGAAVLLSILLCTLSACAMALVVGRERGGPAGLLFAALFSFGPTFQEAGLMARQYALAALVAGAVAGSLAWLLRSREGARRTPAAWFVASGVLLTVTAYQTFVLMVSLLAGYFVAAAVRKDRSRLAVACAASAAYAAAAAPILLVARWQGTHGGPLGVPVATIEPVGGAGEAARSALQLVLSLFVDLPYAHLPVAVLVLGVATLLAGLAWLALRARQRDGAATVLVVSILVASGLYGALVLLRIFPAWFFLRYFVAYSHLYLVLLALAALSPAPGDRSDRRDRLFLTGLLALSCVTFVLRTATYVGGGERQRDREALESLHTAEVVLTDAREHVQVLRIAAHAPGATFWLLVPPLDPGTCRAISDDVRGRRVAVARAVNSDRAALESAYRTCLPGLPAGRDVRRSWLNLTLWGPAETQSP
jgi:hypothetical protein